MGGGARPPGALAVRTCEAGNFSATSSGVPDGSAGATPDRAGDAPLRDAPFRERRPFGRGSLPGGIAGRRAGPDPKRCRSHRTPKGGLAPGACPRGGEERPEPWTSLPLTEVRSHLARPACLSRLSVPPSDGRPGVSGVGGFGSVAVAGVAMCGIFPLSMNTPAVIKPLDVSAFDTASLRERLGGLRRYL